MTPWKIRQLSKFVVVDVRNHYAEAIIWLEEITLHPWVVEDLFCSSYNLLIRPRIGAVKVKGLCHFNDFFDTWCLRFVRSPWIEDVFDVWKKEAVVFSFGTFKHIKERVCYLWFSRDTLICGASKDQKDVLAFIIDFYLFFRDKSATTGQILREHGFIIGLSTTVEDSNNIAIV